MYLCMYKVSPTKPDSGALGASRRVSMCSLHLARSRALSGIHCAARRENGARVANSICLFPHTERNHQVWPLTKRRSPMHGPGLCEVPQKPDASRVQKFQQGLLQILGMSQESKRTFASFQRWCKAHWHQAQDLMHHHCQPLRKFTRLVFGEDSEARSHRVEQFTALWGL